MGLGLPGASPAAVEFQQRREQEETGAHSCCQLPSAVQPACLQGEFLDVGSKHSPGPASAEPRLLPRPATLALTPPHVQAGGERSTNELPATTTAKGPLKAAQQGTFSTEPGAAQHAER